MQKQATERLSETYQRDFMQPILQILKLIEVFDDNVREIDIKIIPVKKFYQQKGVQKNLSQREDQQMQDDSKNEVNTDQQTEVRE